jgi:hypothetical protein
MDRFFLDRIFVGQRIRIRCDAPLELNGRAGRIVARITEVQRRCLPAGFPGEWVISPEDPDGSPPSRTSRTFLATTQQLQPLPPEGMVPVEWIDCAWQPESVLEKVEIPRPVVAPPARNARARGRRFGE